MALKDEAEAVSDKASRIVTIIARTRALLSQTTLAIDDNPDLKVPFTDATRLEWQNRVATLKTEIKTIVAGW